MAPAWQSTLCDCWVAATVLVENRVLASGAPSLLYQLEEGKVGLGAVAAP